MLVMTWDVANGCRGLTVVGHALAPVPMADGTFILPEEVLSDEYHQKHWDFLIANCDIAPDDSFSPGIPMNPDGPASPGGPSVPSIGSDYSQDPDLIAACTYDESWVEGELVYVDPARPKG